MGIVDQIAHKSTAIQMLMRRLKHEGIECEPTVYMIDTNDAVEFKFRIKALNGDAVVYCTDYSGHGKISVSVFPANKHLRIFVEHLLHALQRDDISLQNAITEAMAELTIAAALESSDE